MKTGIWLTAFVVAACTLNGCAWFKSGYAPTANMPSHIEVEPLERDEYVVGEVIEGSNCATFIALFPLPIWFFTADDLGVFVWGFQSTDNLARKGAIYRALETSPDADFMTAPRYKADTTDIGPWFSHVCYEVQGRAARLKSDDEVPVRDVEVAIELKKRSTMPAAPPQAPPVVDEPGPAGDITE